ncbi:deoxyribodipyrimidine photo-lyase [Bacteriovorax sp. Seq25_V]|uniref:cryptochrome/photolyase family protein n=1 Tax=Bacteriovorax sp. Seq25_V TaxID=1201288 RepID=UPI000B9B1CB4|nr:deoxyribodipyrimidine photo-lyase [Bacteriovorax sp. Seq25_V]
MNKAIFWFRRDLRLKDNRGLFEALKSGNKVIPIFIFDKNILKNFSDPKDKRVSFIHHRLSTLHQELKEYGANLRVFYSTPSQVFQDLIKTEEFDAVYTNRDYEPSAIKRDHEISDLLFRHRISFHTFKDHVIFEGDEILKNDRTPYTVYTPYKNKWLQNLTAKDTASFLSEKALDNLHKEKASKIISLTDMGYEDVGEIFPKAQIEKVKLKDYHNTRDIPAIDGTSLQGIHLRFGTISIREYVREAKKINETWLSELIWREFFSQILFNFPNVVNEEFKEKYRKIPWSHDQNNFKRWCEGQTGFPIVDAGMRELNKTGHMHNRVRMITASFLVKDLQIDWRLGEKYFASKLLDFDLASNNGNWQWASSSGCDAAPYFRIFNPTTQMEKFDPELIYVKKWVPEFGTSDYVKPMVDHKVAREKTLALYKENLD